MAASVRSFASAVLASSGTFNVSSPSGSTTNDVLVAFMMTTKSSGAGDQPSTPSGWTLIRSAVYTGSVRLTAFYRSWVSGSHSFTSPSLNSSGCIVVAVQGADVADVTSSTGETADGSPVVLQALTAGAGDVLLSALASMIVTTADADLTVPSGMTARGEINPDAYDYGGGYYGVPVLGVASLDNLSAGSTGTKSWSIAGDFPSSVGFGVLVGAAATATTHTADATLATTATVSPVAQATRQATASVATTASLSAAAEVVKPTAADLATTATITASASVTRAAAADLATTASIDATGSVATPGAQSADATVATTATITAEASVTRAAAADLSVTASIDAAGTATTPGAATGEADLAATVTITASASVTRAAAADLAATVTITATPGGITTRGTMRGIDRAAPRIRPAGTTGTTIRTHVIAFDRATMRAVLDDSATTAPGGVLCFVGPDDPVTVGLVAAGVAHLWFHDGTVTEREGT